MRENGVASHTCKGTVAHGTGCGICANCKRETDNLRESRPVSLLVDEFALNNWEFAVEDPQLKEIIKLARIGLWTVRHSESIKDSLKLALGELSVALVSRFERAMDGMPKELK